MGSRRDRRLRGGSQSRAGPSSLVDKPRTLATPKRPGAPSSVGSGLRRPVGGRVPRVAAVSIKSTSEKVSYTDMLRKAKASFSLKELGIVFSRVREAANGGLLVEVQDPDDGCKADALASRLRLVLGKSALLTRPVKMGEVRVMGFDISVTEGDIKDAIVGAGNCSAGEIKVGSPRRLANGTRAAWVQCPASVADAWPGLVS